MELKELSRTRPDGHSDTSTPPPDPAAWATTVGLLSAEVAAPLTAALERVNTLASTGRIDKASLRALASEIARARHVGITGQKLARMATEPLVQTPETLVLGNTLAAVLDHRAREIQARNVAIKQAMRPVEVIADPTLTFSLIDAVMEWALPHAQGLIELRSDFKTWPMHGQLHARFAFLPEYAQPADPAAPHHAADRLDTMAWQLVEHTARAMGLPLVRTIKDNQVVLTLEFPRTVKAELEAVSATDLSSGGAAAQPPVAAGSHVLVIASRRDVRVQVRDALRQMNLALDFVSSIDEARDFCQSGLPHAIVFEGVLRGSRFNDLRADVDASGADVVFIEIIEEGHTFEISGFGGINVARVGRDAILTALPSALTFELARTA